RSVSVWIASWRLPLGAEDAADEI
ncbi:uncharacterized protein METZ01_LOCUS120589, partial [marine metagenome]